MDPPVTGTWRANRSYGRRVALGVGDPQLEADVLEKCDLGDGAWVVVHASAGRQHAGVGRCRQRNAGIADRVGPLSDSGRVGDRSVEQLLDAQFLGSVGEGGVQTLGVLPDQVNLGRIRAEL